MKTTCYLQIEPEFYSGFGVDRLRNITVKRVTQKRPRDPIPGCVIMKLALDIADAAFLPVTPSAEIVVPIDHTQPVLVETEPVEILV